MDWLKNQQEARRAKLLNEWKNPSKPSQVTQNEPVSNVQDSNTSKTKTSSQTSKKEQPTSPQPTYDSRERALEAMANAQIAIENAQRVASNLDWGRNYRQNNGIFDPIPDFLSEKEYHIPTSKLSLKGGKSVSNTKLTFQMLKDNNLESPSFDPMGIQKSLDFSSIQRINPLLRKLGYDIPKDESIEYYNKLYKDMLGEDEYNKLLQYMRLGLVDSKKHGGNLIPFYQKGTPKEGVSLPTAEPARKRYWNANGIQYGDRDVTIQEIWNPDTNAKIELGVLGKDSTITETPPHSWYITPKRRIAGNMRYSIPPYEYIDKEWPTLKRRFEEAKQVMSRVPYYSPKDGTYPLPK